LLQQLSIVASLGIVFKRIIIRLDFQRGLWIWEEREEEKQEQEDEDEDEEEIGS
jgi:hypothetical protein